MKYQKENLIKILYAHELNLNEKIWLKKYLEDHPEEEELRMIAYEIYSDDINTEAAGKKQLIESPFDGVYKNIAEPRADHRFNRNIRRLSAAAACLLIAGLLSVYHHAKTADRHVAQLIQPGKNQALLTLSNGKKIALADVKNGEKINYGKISISKNSDGQIVYRAAINTNDKVEYNTISTPKAGQYQVILADGTHVWLNAMSSIRFPTSFPGKDRQVEIKGEAYFEVAKDKHKPFKVLGGNQTVEVLGTHFNVNAYQDEETVKTTLLEGSVKITKGNMTAMLSPGQQATTGDVIQVDKADIASAISWKEGYFLFRDADIETVMKQVERWYDVSVKYTGAKPEVELNGKISRQMNLSKLLDMLSYSGVHCRVEGHTIMITN